MKVRPLAGRVAIREILPKAYGSIVVPDDYHEKNERDRTSHRGVVLAIGPAARTRKGVPVEPGFQVGDEVLFVFDASAASGLEGSGATEKSRKSVWPADGGPVSWLCQEEVLAVVEDADGFVATVNRGIRSATADQWEAAREACARGERFSLPMGDEVALDFVPGGKP